MRRRLVLTGALAGTLGGTLGGCGFRPLYLPEGGRGSPASEALAAIYVPVLPERNGQLLRQALQRRIEGAGTGTAKRYELVATLTITTEGVAIQRDTSTSRMRLTASATWSLRKLDLAHTVITTGNSRVLDGYNILDQQYFAADLESETVSRRAVESLSDQIVTQLAIYLKRQAAPPRT